MSDCSPPSVCPFCHEPYGIGKPHAPDCQRNVVAQQVRAGALGPEAPSEASAEQHLLMAQVRDALHEAYQCGASGDLDSFAKIDGAVHRLLLRAAPPQEPKSMVEAIANAIARKLQERPYVRHD